MEQRLVHAEEHVVECHLERVVDVGVEWVHVHHERRLGLRQELQQLLRDGEKVHLEPAGRGREGDAENGRGGLRGRELDLFLEARILQGLLKVAHGGHEVGDVQSVLAEDLVPDTQVKEEWRLNWRRRVSWRLNCKVGAMRHETRRKRRRERAGAREEFGFVIVASRACRRKS